jgi:hypothetical protein
MLKLSALAFSAFLPLAAAAAQPTPRTFVADGQTIEYTRSIDAAGILHLRGRTGKGDTFHFRLTRAGRLYGHAADRSVDVRVSGARVERAFGGASTELASAAVGR